MFQVCMFILDVENTADVGTILDYFLGNLVFGF